MSALKKEKKCPPNQNNISFEKAAAEISFRPGKFAKKKISDHFQKRDFLASEKPGKVVFWCKSELGKHLSATISIYYGNKVNGISI